MRRFVGWARRSSGGGVRTRGRHSGLDGGRTTRQKRRCKAAFVGRVSRQGGMRAYEPSSKGRVMRETGDWAEGHRVRGTLPFDDGASRSTPHGGAVLRRGRPSLMNWAWADSAVGGDGLRIGGPCRRSPRGAILGQWTPGARHQGYRRRYDEDSSIGSDTCGCAGAELAFAAAQRRALAGLWAGPLGGRLAAISQAAHRRRTSQPCWRWL